jgi:hypothetical protein
LRYSAEPSSSEDSAVRRVLIGLAVAFAAVAVATGGAAAASSTVRLTIVHVVQGCHVWGDVSGNPLSASRTLKVKRGTKLAIRINCPMSFDFVQLAGPKLALGASLTHAGTVRTLVFAKRGIYKLQATNVESSEQMGMTTLGPDNVLVLTVRVS